MIFISQMRKLRFKKIKKFTQGHTGRTGIHTQCGSTLKPMLSTTQTSHACDVLTPESISRFIPAHLHQLINSL